MFVFGLNSLIKSSANSCNLCQQLVEYKYLVPQIATCLNTLVEWMVMCLSSSSFGCMGIGCHKIAACLNILVEWKVMCILGKVSLPLFFDTFDKSP